MQLPRDLPAHGSFSQVSDISDIMTCNVHMDMWHFLTIASIEGFNISTRMSTVADHSKCCIPGFAILSCFYGDNK